MERSAELLAQEAELTTDQLGQCMQFVTTAIGANPSKAGFLSQFWMLLWDILVARSASATAGKPGPGLPGILNQMMASGSGKTTPTLSTLASSPVPSPDNQELQRMRLHMAMAAAGLQGRDPTALNQAEMAAVAAILQQIPVPGGPGRPAPSMQAQPQTAPTAPSGNAPSGQGQPTQQQIMQYQTMLMQQQQMMFHQQQMMIQQQQMKTGGTSTGHRQGTPQQQQQPQRTQMIPMQSMPPRNISAEEENAMMSFLQVPGQSNRPQTAMDTAARKSSLLLAGSKRQRTDYVSSDQLMGMPNVQLDPALFLNMPEFDEEPTFESPFADGTQMNSTPNRTFGAHLDILGKFDGVHEQRLASVHISSDSRLAVSAGRDKKIVIYDIQEKRVVGVLPMTHKDRVSRARIAPAGKKRLLVSGAFDKTVQLWDLGELGAPLVELPEKPMAVFSEDHSGPIISVAFANKADEQTGNVDIIASCDCEGTLVLRSIKENRVLQVIRDSNKSTVRMISFYPDGDHLIALALDDRVDVYDWREGKMVYTIKAPNGRPVICIDWDRGVLLVTTDTDCYVWAVDFSLPLPSSASYTGRMVAKFTTPGDKIHSGIVIRNGAAPLDEFLKPIQSRLILIGGWKKLFLWKIGYELVAGKRPVDERGRVLTIDAHDDLVAAVSSGGKLEELPYILSGGLDNNVILWKLASRPSASRVSSLSDVSEEEVAQINHQLMMPESPAAQLTGSSSVDELTAPLDFDPVTMFLNTDDL